MAVFDLPKMNDSSGLSKMIENLLVESRNATKKMSTKDSQWLDIMRKVLLDSNISSNYSGNFDDIMRPQPPFSTSQLTALIVAYSIISVVALFGNALVCHVIIKNPRLHTVTHMFIANMAVSDLLMTCINFPVLLARRVTIRWIYGAVMCHAVNTSLATSIYVSTFTMTAIAVDRYFVILYPLRPRLAPRGGSMVVLVTWTLGALFSLPFALFARVEEVEFFFETSSRCRIVYPEPAALVERCVTVATFLAQYVIPVTLTAIAYGFIVHFMWCERLTIGHPSVVQQKSHDRTRRKTVKMLIVVVVIFSACWLPLNIYHLLTDLHPDSAFFAHNSAVYLACHWLATSSACYNPFIYCWLNESFQNELRNLFICLRRRQPRVHPAIMLDDGRLVRCDLLSVLTLQAAKQKRHLLRAAGITTSRGSQSGGGAAAASSQDQRNDKLLSSNVNIHHTVQQSPPVHLRRGINSRQHTIMSDPGLLRTDIIALFCVKHSASNTTTACCDVEMKLMPNHLT